MQDFPFVVFDEKDYSLDIFDEIDNVWCKMAFEGGIWMSLQNAGHKFMMLSQKHPRGNVRLMHGKICVMHNI